MMLIDKPFYDYDYEPVKKAVKRILIEDTIKDDEESFNILSRFGIGQKKEESLEHLQELAMKEMSENNLKE